MGRFFSDCSTGGKDILTEFSDLHCITHLHRKELFRSWAEETVLNAYFVQSQRFFFGLLCCLRFWWSSNYRRHKNHFSKLANCKKSKAWASWNPFWSLGISKLNDEGYLKKLAESRRAITGRDSKKPHKQLHLFCGPPATGKTMAMKILAAEGGLSAQLFLNLKLFQKKLCLASMNGLLLWRLLSPWEVSKHFSWCWASLATAHWRKCKTLWRGSMSDLAVSILVCTCTFLVWFLTAPVECEVLAVLAIRCGRGSRLGQMRLVWQSSSTKLSKSLAAGETCRIFTVSKQKYLDA